MDNRPAPLIQEIHLVPGQAMRLYLRRGAVVHVTQGRAELAGAPAWLAETVYRARCALAAGAVQVADRAGWVTVVAATSVSLRVTMPVARPWWWSLIKLRSGRSGFLPGNARPPDTQADVSSGPHATTQRSKTPARP